MFDSVRYIHGGKFISKGSWAQSDRIIDSFEIIIMIKGAAYINVGGIDRTLLPGDVLRINPGIRHYGYKTSDIETSFYWLHFITDGNVDDGFPPEMFTPDDSYQSELICRQIIHCERADGYPRETCDLLMRVLLAELCVQSRGYSEKDSRVFRSICDFIRKNSDRMLRVSDVAAEFSYNEDYLGRLFKRYYPAGIKAYIDAKKMEKLKKELISGISDLKTIAAENSFSDYRYFLKYFRYHEGITPSKFRETYCVQNINNK